jgi:hypothetical protein
MESPLSPKRPITALTRTVLKPIETSNDPLQCSAQSAKRKQPETVSKIQSTTISSKHDNKPLQQRSPLYINPVNIYCYIFIAIILRQYMRLLFQFHVLHFIFIY